MVNHPKVCCVQLEVVVASTCRWGGKLVCESVGKADLLSDHFDCKEYRESADLPLTCHPPPSLVTFAFRSSEVRRLFLHLDPSGGTDSLGVSSFSE